MNWQAQLKPMPNLRKLWLAGGRDLDDQSQDLHRGLAADIAHVTHGANSNLNLLHIRRAKDHIRRLPEIGETINAVVSGVYPLWAIVPAVLELASPATITRAYILTLSLSKDNGLELVQLIDAGKIQNSTLIASHYFAHTSKTLWEPLKQGLERRGQRVAALRSHAKLICLEMSDGRGFVVTGSANLRSCKNLECFVFTQDKALFNFHAEWIDKLLQEGTE